MKRRVITLVLLAVLSVAAQVTQAVVFIAYSEDDNSLYMLTAPTMQATIIGTLEIPDAAHVSALVWLTDNTAYTTDTTANALYTIDLTDASTICSVSLDADILVWNRGLGMSPEGVLYGIFAGNQLRTINPENGTTALVADINGPLMESIAFSFDGTLYGGSAGNIYELAMETGEVALISDTPFLDIDTLTFAPDGYLYATDSEAGWAAHLYRIDPLTGTATDLGGTGITGFNGLSAVPKPAPVINASLDIKPRSCPNPLNVKSKGVLPVAILGSDDFDVYDIDVASIRLAGVAPIRSSFEDVATPVVDGSECECTKEGPDGYFDLTLKFKSQEIVAALGDVNDGDILPLTLEGALSDETPIEGADCIVVRGKAKSLHRADINSDGFVDLSDFAVFAANWLEFNTPED